jgi:16S rRNA (uracil1498-N3)-methyltransferase
MNDQAYFKLPRLYSAEDLKGVEDVTLLPEQAHYLKNVLRRKEGDNIRLFDGLNGEWLASLSFSGKKSASAKLERQLQPQPEKTRRIHLAFAPIKKHRLDWLVEKAVELGVTDLHPVLTQNTEVRKINSERMAAQIFEAAEQCERFEIPTLHPLYDLTAFLAQWSADVTLFSCLERYEGVNKPTPQKESFAILIGPEGGFTAEEKKLVAVQTHPITLGDTVYRCETAAIKALVLISGE